MSSEMEIKLRRRVVGKGELSPGDLPLPPIPESLLEIPKGLFNLEIKLSFTRAINMPCDFDKLFL